MPSSKTAWNRIIRRIKKAMASDFPDRDYNGYYERVYFESLEGVDVGYSLNLGPLTGEDLFTAQVMLEQDIADSLNGKTVATDRHGQTIPAIITQAVIGLAYEELEEYWPEGEWGEPKYRSNFRATIAPTPDNDADPLWLWHYVYFKEMVALGQKTDPWVRDGQMEWTVKEKNGRGRR